MNTHEIQSIRTQLHTADATDDLTPNPMAIFGPERLKVEAELGPCTMEKYWASVNAIHYAEDNAHIVGGANLESLNPLQLRKLAIEWCRDCGVDFRLQYDGVEAIFSAALPNAVSAYAAAFGEIPMRALEQKRS